MILVDTSLWIDYLHKSNHTLVDLLLADVICVHPFVIEEIALGSIARRSEFLATLDGLQSVDVVSHDDVLDFVAEHELWGQGLNAVDAHLLASAVASGGGVELWTGDNKLKQAAERLGVAHSG